jgi:hypothetical protein
MRMGEEIDEREAAAMRSAFAGLEAQLEAAFDALAAGAAESAAPDGSGARSPAE